jgi:hypothetical protein
LITTILTRLTRETLEDHLHVVDVGVRELQLRAHGLVTQRSGAGDETVRLFASTLHLRDTDALDSGAMRAAVLQQVARMEMLITGTELHEASRTSHKSQAAATTPRSSASPTARSTIRT